MDVRKYMVQAQVESRGVSDKRILKAMRKVERHLLVPPELALFAYDDHPLPIGAGQTISQPYIVALMTELLHPEPGQRILEIGTGSGYQAAVLAEIVADVYTVEIIPALAKNAERNLIAMGYANIHFRVGDGGDGWPEESPFDGIIVTAAVRQLPPAWDRQLKTGGRMVVPMGAPDDVQTLQTMLKREAGIEMVPNIPVRFVPLTGKTQD